MDQYYAVRGGFYIETLHRGSSCCKSEWLIPAGGGITAPTRGCSVGAMSTMTLSAEGLTILASLSLVIACSG